MISPPPGHHPDTIPADTTLRIGSVGAPDLLIAPPVPASPAPAAAASVRTAGRSDPDAAHPRPTSRRLAGDRRIAGLSLSQRRRRSPVLGRIGLLLLQRRANRSARGGHLRAGRPVPEGRAARDRQQSVSPIPDPAAVR